MVTKIYKLISDFTLDELQNEIRDVSNENITINYTSDFDNQFAWGECIMNEQYRKNMIWEDEKVVIHYSQGLKIIFNQIKIRIQ